MRRIHTSGTEITFRGRNGEHKALWASSQYLGESVTNNEAEYHGLVVGLEEARKKGIEGVVVFGDSQLVIEQLLGNYKVHAKNLKPIWAKAVRLKKQFPAGVSLMHIDRDKNQRADQLANEAMDRGCSEEYATELWDSGAFLPKDCIQLSQYWTMGVKKLKEECKKRKLPYYSSKQDLVATILASEIECDEDLVRLLEQKNWSTSELLVHCKALERRRALHEQDQDDRR